jgi:dienelactone hydrolase
MHPHRYTVRRHPGRALPALAVLLLALSLSASAHAADKPAPVTVERDPTSLGGAPFERYFTHDKFGRKITFYLSVVQSAKPPLPLAVLIQGSGCQSVFQKRDDKILGGLQNVLLTAVQGRARVLIVEKPGVRFLDQAQRPGSAQGAAREFLEEHTLPRWAEAIGAAIRAAHTLPGIDTRKTLVIGHSEGGIMAARVAAENPHLTHVASLAGGGPTQLFSLAELARQGYLGDPSQDAEARVRSVYEGWAKIQADPESVTKFQWGHPYRRWFSFLKSSVTAELLRSKVPIYLAQGAEDTNSPVGGFDVLYAELLAQGRKVTMERLQGANHSFQPKGASGYPKEMQELLGRVVDWFLKSDPQVAPSPPDAGRSSQDQPSRTRI